MAFSRERADAAILCRIKGLFSRTIASDLCAEICDVSHWSKCLMERQRPENFCSLAHRRSSLKCRMMLG